LEHISKEPFALSLSKGRAVPFLTKSESITKRKAIRAKHPHCCLRQGQQSFDAGFIEPFHRAGIIVVRTEREHEVLTRANQMLIRASIGLPTHRSRA
jgi:hypothetical protein